jgi:uncharacterized protein YcbX
MSDAAVSALRATPVKGLHMSQHDEIELTLDGARGNRVFFVIDERDRMVNGKLLGALTEVQAHYDPAGGRLELCFPSGEQVAGEVRLGESVSPRFYSRTLPGRLVDGDFARALSEHAGTPLRLVAPERGAVDRGRHGAVSLISTGSLRRLSEQAGVAVDARRFRMLVEVDGLDAHQEDGFVGQRVRIGAALVRFHGHVGRCLVTSRNPDSGEIDLPTLELLDYRGGLERTEPLAFGVYGEVLEPGPVRVGDPVALLA